MEAVTKLGTRMYGEWQTMAYDLHIHYGYKTMLLLFDRFISEYQVRVVRIAKAELSGQNNSVVWRRLLFNKPKPLSEMTALKEECGEVSIGCLLKAFRDVQLQLFMDNQTSIVVFQVPNAQCSEKVQEHIESIAQFFQTTLLTLN